jgi:hypothetical protein
MNHLQWLFGSALEDRLNWEQTNKSVLWSKIARSLLSGTSRLSRFWEHSVSQYAAMLNNAYEAPLKVARDINIHAHDFDNQLFNAFAEILAVNRLICFGCTHWRPLLPLGDQKMFDFACMTAGESTAVEVKNLRVHRFAEDVALRLHADRQLKQMPGSEYTLVLLRSSRQSLGRDDRAGESRITDILTRASTMARSTVHEEPISQNIRLRFRVENDGESRIEDYVDEQDLLSEPITDAMRNKIGRVTDDAYLQLFSPAAEPFKRRILALRWDVPSYEFLRPPAIAQVLEADFKALFDRKAKSFGVYVFSDYRTEYDGLHLESGFGVH